jgi:hypothetical protein
MSPFPTESLEARIARLERANRRLRRLIALAALGAAALLLMGQRVDIIQTANRFEVVDDHGSLRGVFGLNSDGETVLSFYDAQGTENVVFRDSWQAVEVNPQTGEREPDAQSRHEEEADQAERAVHHLGERLSDTLNRAEEALDQNVRNR